MVKIFVFGTCKRGFPLHEAALCDASFLGPCQTVERDPMLIAGPWYAPMLLPEPGRGLRVKGELYEIADSRLVEIDAIESIGKPGNLRIIVAIERRNGQSCRAFAYAKSPALAAPVHSGFLDDYQDRRFIPSWRRPAAIQRRGERGARPSWAG
jgi:gamma-glutamylaminecyclotransferase